MIAYTSYIGSKRRRDKVVALGCRMLVPADRSSKLSVPTCRYAVDSGAWAAHTRGEPFNEEKFVRGLAKLGENADWIVLPDIVGGGSRSLELSVKWLKRMKGKYNLVLAVQDGIRPIEVMPYLGRRVGIFLGGTTEFKIETMPHWGRASKIAGCYFHVGRVNSAKRVKLCQDAGAHSFDGSGISRWFDMKPEETFSILEQARKSKVRHFWG